MSQYPLYYPPHVPAPITVPQPQPYVQPQPAVRPVIPVITQAIAQSAAAQPEPAVNNKPVIPPAPPREQTKKRKPTRKKMPTAVITFDLPNGQHARKPFQTEEKLTPPPDLSRSLSSSAPLHQSPAASPARSNHERRASTHSSSQIHRPTDSADERPSNPLPKLPVDIFTTAPYKHVLEPKELPAWPPLGPGNTFAAQQETHAVPQQAKKGRLFGLKKKNPPPPLSQPKRLHLPQSASAKPKPPPTSATTTTTTANPPTSTTTTDPTATHTGFQSSPLPISDPGPDARAFESPLHDKPIYFNQDTEYAPFLNHSPHSVSYERVRYPTATHLIEAMKFLPEDKHNRGIAELIRKCVDLADVYRLSHEHREAQNEENGELYMEKMERVMYLKFNQHGELANLLLRTGEAPLVYDDPSDSFWGIGESNGEPGQNELGHMLECIRARLRHERMK
ncbi:hypothetical protein C0995_007285 [Termitomyces sp. Mi166|nr:hypothetical protein C0995_007285 [Termitomyces sp. Mi166\